MWWLWMLEQYEGTDCRKWPPCRAPAVTVVTEKILSYTNCWSDSVKQHNLISLWHFLTWKCSSCFVTILPDIYLFPLDFNIQKLLYMFLWRPWAQHGCIPSTATLIGLAELHLLPRSPLHWKWPMFLAQSLPLPPPWRLPTLQSDALPGLWSCFWANTFYNLVFLSVNWYWQKFMSIRWANPPRLQIRGKHSLFCCP